MILNDGPQIYDAKLCTKSLNEQYTPHPDKPERKKEHYA